MRGLEDNLTEIQLDIDNPSRTKVSRNHEGHKVTKYEF